MTRSPLLKPRDVARIFDVEVTTVVGWARTGKLAALKTPGGQQYRFRAADIEAALSNVAEAIPDEQMRESA